MSYETRSARKYFPLTKVDADIEGGTVRGLLVATAGTANLTEDDGTERNGVPLVQGWNPMYVKRVRPGGSADGIWGYR